MRSIVTTFGRLDADSILLFCIAAQRGVSIYLQLPPPTPESCELRSPAETPFDRGLRGFSDEALSHYKCLRLMPIDHHNLAIVFHSEIE